MLINLRPNLLTEDENDFSAVVKHQGSKSIEDVARAIIADGTESDELTLIDIYKKMERKIVQLLAQGYTVDTTMYHAMATVSGKFVGKSARFDSKEGHAIGIALNICPAALRQIADGTQVENMGLLQSGPEVSIVLDKYTGLAAGAQTRSVLTPNRTLQVRGKNLRISWDGVGTHAIDCGIFLQSTTTPAMRIRVADHEVITNMPSELLFTIPSLTPGNYWLELVTQSSSNSAQTLKEPRMVRFEIPLTVEVI